MALVTVMALPLSALMTMSFDAVTLPLISMGPSNGSIELWTTTFPSVDSISPFTVIARAALMSKLLNEVAL